MTFDFSDLSDQELSELVGSLAKRLIAAQGEQNTRIYQRLAKAYGHELPLVKDVFAGVRTTASGDIEVIWCFYCGLRAGWQQDHKIPRSRGGSNEPSNLAPACATCNYQKSTMTVEEYRASIERRTGAAHVFFGERDGK